VQKTSNNFIVLKEKSAEITIYCLKTKLLNQTKAKLLE
jgi:hypothetical protein